MMILAAIIGLVMIAILFVAVNMNRDTEDQIAEIRDELEKYKCHCRELVIITKKLNRENEKLKSWVYRYLPYEGEDE